MGTSHHDEPNGESHHHDVHDHKGHGHHHGHLNLKKGQDNSKSIKQLKRVIALTLLFMFIEGIGGYYTNSLALMSDSVHMLADTGALVLSLFAFYMSARPATDSRTYGFYRLEILAAFINGVFLVVLSLIIIWGAWVRYQEPMDIKSVEMFWISTLGLLFNLFGAWILTRGGSKNLNITGALFHVLGDALGAFGAMLAALMIYFWGWNHADAAVSVIIALIIIASSFRLILDTTHVIIEGAPHHLNTDHIRQAISKCGLVKEVHDLHVWSITSGMVSLSVHVVASEGSRHTILCEIRNMLKEKFQIEHVTIQIEDQSLKAAEPHI